MRKFLALAACLLLVAGTAQATAWYYANDGGIDSDAWSTDFEDYKTGDMTWEDTVSQRGHRGSVKTDGTTMTLWHTRDHFDGGPCGTILEAGGNRFLRRNGGGAAMYSPCHFHSPYINECAGRDVDPDGSDVSNEHDYTVFHGGFKLLYSAEGRFRWGTSSSGYGGDGSWAYSSRWYVHDGCIETYAATDAAGTMTFFSAGTYNAGWNDIEMCIMFAQGTTAANADTIIFKVNGTTTYTGTGCYGSYAGNKYYGAAGFVFWKDEIYSENGYDYYIDDIWYYADDEPCGDGPVIPEPSTLALLGLGGLGLLIRRKR
jgi:hypothetical protein